MATTKEIKEHLEIALKEIGKIKPWFDEEVNEWIFSHPNYPVEYGGKSAKEVIDNYPKYLLEFINLNFGFISLKFREFFLMSFAFFFENKGLSPF